LQLNTTPFKPINGTIAASPSDPKVASVLHHHHVPRHHHHHVTPAPKPVIVPLPKTTIRSSPVLDSVAHLPRYHLGHDYYQADLNPRGRVSSRDTSRRGFASTPRPLPRFEGQENCTFTVKVPCIYLASECRAEITSRRAVWGSDIYTDDSDVIAACIHQGWFRGEWDADVDVSLLGLELGDGPPDPPKKFLAAPPPKGPMEVLPNHDCHIKVLILPPLEKYSSTTRFGIRSREWGGKHDGYQGVHDGLSFMVMSVTWVSGDGKEGGNGMKRRELLESEREAEKEDEMFFAKMDGIARKGSKAGIPESFERGDYSEFPRDIKGVATRSWWKATPRASKQDTVPEEEKVLEVDAEMDDVQAEEPEEDTSMETGGFPQGPPTEQPNAADDASIGKPDDAKVQKHKSIVELVTERMIENANSYANSYANSESTHTLERGSDETI
jgi:hypothetical protein